MTARRFWPLVGSAELSVLLGLVVVCPQDAAGRVAGGPVVVEQQDTVGPHLLIEDVTLIDGTGRPPVAGAYVLVEGDRIA